MYRILLVDDEILVRDAIKENIDWKALDCELVGDCENGQQAAEFVQHHPVDIVLTDILMPYMDGMELSRFLHDNYPDIVIVIFSGFGEFEYAQKAIKYNVSEYLLKPVTAVELTAVINKMKLKVDQQRKDRKQMENLAQTQEDYRKNIRLIQSKTLEDLVGCTTDVRQAAENLRGMGIDLSAVGYRVAVFDIDLYSELYQVDTEKRQESALMAFVLYNISDEIVEREKAGVAYQEGSNRVCILFTEKWSRNSGGGEKVICAEIQQKMKEVMGIDVSVGIGGRVQNLEKLVLSHDAAEKALQYRYLLGGSLLFDVEEKKLTGDVYLYHALETLKSALKSGSRADAGKALGAMEEEIRSGLVDKSRACMYLQQIVRTADGAWMDVAPDKDAVVKEQEDILRRINEEPTFDEAFAIVREHAEKILECLEDANSSSGQRQARMALDYIRENYMDPNLSLNSICSYLNISTSYFSSIFKALTGETFTEVLIRARMEKAMELLENTTMKNYEIAEKVGFSDSHYFGISFKKITGRTPTEFAREKRK